MFRDIVTYRCFECDHQWVAPHIKDAVKCPKCHSSRTGTVAYEHAPLPPRV